MEYSSDALAQAAYISSDFSSDILTGGTPSADSFYGGRSKMEFDGRILAGDFKGAIAIPYCTEKTKLGGHVKLGEIVWWDFVFPFVAKDIFSSGGGNNKGGITGGKNGGPGGIGGIGGSTR